MLGNVAVEEIHLIDENVFGELATYPTITTVINSRSASTTRIISRDARTRDVRLSVDATSWMPFLNGGPDKITGPSLRDICVRISCGVATGADAAFVIKTVPAGQEVNPKDSTLSPKHFMLIPYSRSGKLLREPELGELDAYLRQPQRREMLLKRTCVARKPWYAFHERPPLPEILRPKILCKDIARNSFFVVDETGVLVPRHSVYYIVPEDPSGIFELADYLNSPRARFWLIAHCQRATNNFLRLQSHILKQLPIPDELLPGNASVAAPAEKIPA